MKIFILTVLAFGFWFFMMMMSPMLVSAPSNEPASWKVLLFLAGIIFLPVILGGIYLHFGWSLWGLSPKLFIGLCFIASISFATLMGYPHFFMLAFRRIPYQGVYVSKDGVYMQGELIAGADPKTFTAVDDSDGDYYKDKNQVYRYEQILQGADPATFHAASPKKALYRVYWLDHQHVYSSGVLVPEADVKTFEALGQGSYARDSKHVFFRGKIVEGADPQSFEITEDENSETVADSKDKNRSYKSGKAL